MSCPLIFGTYSPIDALSSLSLLMRSFLEAGTVARYRERRWSRVQRRILACNGLSRSVVVPRGPSSSLAGLRDPSLAFVVPRWPSGSLAGLRRPSLTFVVQDFPVFPLMRYADHQSQKRITSQEKSIHPSMSACMGLWTGPQMHPCTVCAHQ